MIISNGWYISFVAAVLVVKTAVGAFTFSLEPAVIQPGERATLTLRLPESDLIQTGTDEETFPEAQDEWLVKADSLELLEQDYRKVNGEYVWTYQFTSYQPGEISLPPISVTLGPQSFSTVRTPLKIESSRSAQDFSLRPNAPLMQAPWNWWGVLEILFLCAAVASAAWYFKYLWKPRTRMRAPDAVVAPREDPVEWLRKQLLVLRAKLDAKPRDPEAPDRWAGILREFASRKTSFPVTAWTTKEMQNRLRGDPKFQTLSQWMQECDKVKFAPGHEAHSGNQTLNWIEQSEKLFL